MVGCKSEGRKNSLFREGVFMKKNMNRTNITEHDILEDLRLDSFGGIKEVYMERSEISFVKKDG
jgi:hypothetical protein